MLSSRLSLCTANSIRATTLPESALTVVSIRLGHFALGLCISTGEKLVWRMFQWSSDSEILTLQTYERWRSRKAVEVTLLEYALELGVKLGLHNLLSLCGSRSTPILQLEPNFALEVIILGEHRYYRDFPDVNPSFIGSHISTYHSCPGRYCQNTLDLTMVDHCPSECST
jgi:hypothetical protein